SVLETAMNANLRLGRGRGGRGSGCGDDVQRMVLFFATGPFISVILRKGSLQPARSSLSPERQVSRCPSGPAAIRPSLTVSAHTYARECGRDWSELSNFPMNS